MDLEYLAIYVLAVGPFIGLAVGIAYFLKSNPNATLGLRLLSSAFGPSLVLLLVIVGSSIWPDRLRYNETGFRAYYWLQVLPALLLAFALTKYPGNRSLHLVLVPLGLLAWAGSFAWGWVFVHGK